MHCLLLLPLSETINCLLGGQYTGYLAEFDFIRPKNRVLTLDSRARATRPVLAISKIPDHPMHVHFMHVLCFSMAAIQVALPTLHQSGVLFQGC